MVHEFVWMFMVFNVVLSVPCVIAIMVAIAEVVVIMVRISVTEFVMLTMFFMFFIMILCKVFQAAMVAPMWSPLMVAVVSPMSITVTMMWMVDIMNRLALFWSPVNI